jgi:4-hydroxy-tetrahydrodipicolinate reductase
VRVLRVAMAGVTGKTGSEVARAIWADRGTDLVAAVARRRAGEDLGTALGGPPWGVAIESDLEAAMRRTRPDVMVDFTDGETGGRHAVLALAHDVRPVVGSTGLPAERVVEVERLVAQRGLAAALIANFSFGAMLLQRFALQALSLFPAAEVIERHHDTKRDAPSGTAARLGRVMEAQGGRPVPIHSVRLPGLLAHHEVVFGGPGETLLIRHDTMSRASFAPGVLLAIRRVVDLRGAVIRDLADLVPD